MADVGEAERRFDRVDPGHRIGEAATAELAVHNTPEQIAHLSELALGAD